jgi:hypothetical protein
LERASDVAKNIPPSSTGGNIEFKMINNRENWESLYCRKGKVLRFMNLQMKLLSFDLTKKR